MNPVLLIRKEFASKYELQHAERYFTVEQSRTKCADSLVIGRYSVVPFYDELERDLACIGSRLINTFEQHQWIATFGYYQHLKEFTPETWNEESFATCSYPGPFVVKGTMSSKKRKWKTHMFAPTKRDALRLGERLLEDTNIGDQGIVYRKYIPLRTLEMGPNELRYTNEWRFFYYKQLQLSRGYYWSMADCADKAELKSEAHVLADKVASIAAEHSNFFALDIAETEDGRWILIELNDGQSAGPCDNDLDALYGNLRRAIAAE